MAFEKELKFALLCLFCASTFSATVPTETFALSPSQESSLALVNGSTITNLTDVTPLNRPPPDPYPVWPWLGSGGTFVTFSDYDSEIWYTDALNVILEASRAAALQIFKGKGDTPMGRILKYVFGSVTLNFNPQSNLTWKTWNLILTAFTGVFLYEYTGFSFTVSVDYSPAGTGSLRGAASTTPQATPQAA